MHGIGTSLNTISTHLILDSSMQPFSMGFFWKDIALRVMRGKRRLVQAIEIATGIQNTTFPRQAPLMPIFKMK